MSSCRRSLVDLGDHRFGEVGEFGLADFGGDDGVLLATGGATCEEVGLPLAGEHRSQGGDQLFGLEVGAVAVDRPAEPLVILRFLGRHVHTVETKFNGGGGDFELEPFAVSCSDLAEVHVVSCEDLLHGLLDFGGDGSGLLLGDGAGHFSSSVV